MSYILGVAHFSYDDHYIFYAYFLQGFGKVVMFCRVWVCYNNGVGCLFGYFPHFHFSFLKATGFVPVVFLLPVFKSGHVLSC